MSKQNHKITFRICNQGQKELAIQFLQALQIADDQKIEKCISDLFANEGGFIVGYTGNEIVCLFGYKLERKAQGDDTAGRATVPLIVTRPDHQVFQNILPGIQVLMHHLSNKGIREIELLAAVNDKYANKLYYPLARIIGLRENIWGATSVLYASSTEDILSKLNTQPHDKTKLYTGIRKRNVRPCLIS